MTRRSPPPPLNLQQILEARLRTLLSSPRYYRTAAHRFLLFLQADFPQVSQLSELRRDPHLLGWVRSLCEQDPPLSNSSRRIYLLSLRRLLRDFASEGHAVSSELILPEDFPAGPQRNRPLQPKIRRTPAPRVPPHPLFAEIFHIRIQTLATTLRPQTVQSYRVAARRFLCYLQTDFPHLVSLSDLCRDPHLLGWFQKLREQHPPLSRGTRQLYLLKLRRLLYEANSDGHSVPPGLLLSADIPAARPPRPKPERASAPPHIFQPLFETPLSNVATTVRPGTVQTYRRAVQLFLSFLQTDFPHLRQVSELRRDPYLLAWFRHLCQRTPPLSSNTRQKYLFALRRLLTELASLGYPVPPGLILREDFPPLPHYLPRALSPEDDQRLQHELRRADDLHSNALLLTRLTGMRIGECIHLASHCLRPLGQNQWALHVPLGKLYTERFVPADADIRQIVSRLRALRDQDPSPLHASTDRLLPRPRNSKALYAALRICLRQAAQRAACSSPVTCHQLRHTFATEMLRLGVSLPALMQLLGHKDIRMTMRYLQVTQQDLQREFHLARQSAAHHHAIPKLALPDPFATADLAGVQRALRATRHLLEMYRRQLGDEKTGRKVQRLARRLLDIASQLKLIATA